MKKNIVMALLAASTPTLAIAVDSRSNIVKVTSEVSPISISISNQVNIPLLEARVKLKPSEEWIELGDIKPGDNNYLVHDELTGAERGILQAKQPNGQWINAMFKKEQDTYIEIVLEESKEVMTAQSWQNAKIDTIGGRLLVPGVYGEQGEELSYSFQPVSTEQRNYSYSGFCTYVGEWLGIVTCTIDSFPKVQWVGTGGEPAIGTTYGSFIMTNAAPFLVGVEGAWGFFTSFLHKRIWAPHMDFTGDVFSFEESLGGGAGEYRWR